MMSQGLETTWKSFFEQYGELTDHDLERIEATAKLRNVRKGSHLLSEGEVCSDFFLVVSGAFRLHYLREGVDTSVWFSFENNSSIELYSYLSGSPSEYFIECIEDGEVLVMAKQQVDSICESNERIKKLFGMFWQDVVQSLVKRLTDLQKYSPRERYIRLLEDTDYLNRIPQKYLASYIGVTTTSLSRIKRNLHSKLS